MERRSLPIRSWGLNVLGNAGNRTLALVAPHGTFPVAGLGPLVREIIQKLRIGTEVRCVGEGSNISTLHVDRILGPIEVLEPSLLSLPETWVQPEGALLLARARLLLDAGRDPTADLVAALRANTPGAEVQVARLADRAAIEDDYAAWCRTRPVWWDTLKLLPMGRWSDDQVRGALEWSLGAGGAFGTMSAEELLLELGRRGVEVKGLSRKLARLRGPVRPVRPPGKPKPAAKLVAWFDVLVTYGVLPAMEPPARDALLLGALEGASARSPRSLALLVEQHSPLAIGHDTHAFEARDRIIGRFDAPLDGEPVRFAEKDISTSSVTIEVRANGGVTTTTWEPFVWTVAEVLDAELKRGGASRRIYALDRYQDDIYVYLVLSPATREALVAAGIKGIGKNARAKLPS